MLPNDVWNIIYHYSYFQTLVKLRLTNKQCYENLSQNHFWMMYSQNKLIKNIKYNNALEWMKELYYIKYIDHTIDILKLNCLCKYIIKHGERRGEFCNKYTCEHVIYGKVNKGQIIILLKNQLHTLDYFLSYQYPTQHCKLIIGNKYVSVEHKEKQFIFQRLNDKELRLLLYQALKI